MKSPLAESEPRPADRGDAARRAVRRLDRRLRSGSRRSVCDMPKARRRRCFPRGPPDLVAGVQPLGRPRACSTASERRRAREARHHRADPPRRADPLRHGRAASGGGARGLAVLAMPPHAAARRCGSSIETVDGIWYAAGDKATDFSFYTKRATLAALYGAAVLYWLDDRSPGFTDTERFVDRRLADLRPRGASFAPASTRRAGAVSRTLPLFPRAR